MQWETNALRALPRDLDFILYDVLGLAGRADHAPLIQAAMQVAGQAFAPCAAELDACEPHLMDGRLVLPAALKPAVDAFTEAGFLAAPFPEVDGGLGLPYTVWQALVAPFQLANPGAAGYPLLTAAAANLLRAHGSPAQKRRYMAPMLEGRFFGTMALSEPQAGSSLADLRCKALRQPDGSYHLVGDKMWISAGAHDLAEAIVHLVLARLPDAPAGSKGISLFVVPKYRVEADGSLGAR
ncbi:MAG: acyl-CoA dehydrogenase family protein, partial [Myxococcales bacterium]|nr:acyl-CoA dehydrogenase family protein [Myxococcales bacterium]